MQGRAICAFLLIVSCYAADDYEQLCQQADALTTAGKYSEAADKYKAALILRPEAPEALNNLAVAYYEMRQYGDAFETASRIWGSHREFRSAALIAGMAAVQLNRLNDAIAPFQSLLASDPANRDALLGLASAYIGLHRLPDAANLYEREISDAPKDSAGWYGLAICYERMAEDASRKLAEMPGGAPYSKRLLGEFLLSRGDTQLAREAFGDSMDAAETGSSAAAIQYRLARSLADKSRHAFEQFVGLAPTSWQAELFFGDVDRQHRAFASALDHYGKAARQQPQNPAPLVGMGTVYWEMGEFDRAQECLRQTLQLNPRSVQATFELGNIAVRQHRDSEAIPLLQTYLAEQPDALAARGDLGRAYLHLHQYENAVAELRKALDADGAGDIHYQLAMALRHLGRTREAEEALKKSTELRNAQLNREQRLHSAR